MFQQVLYILRCDSLVWIIHRCGLDRFLRDCHHLGAAWTTELLLEIQRLRDLIRNLSCYLALGRRLRAIIHRFHTISGSSSGINASGWNGIILGVK